MYGVVGYQESSIDRKGFGVPEAITDLRAVAHKDLERGDVVTFMGSAITRTDGSIGVQLDTADPASFAGPKVVGVALEDAASGEEIYFRISGLVGFVKTADSSSEKFLKPDNASNALSVDAVEAVSSIGQAFGDYSATDEGTYDVQLFGVARIIA